MSYNVEKLWAVALRKESVDRNSVIVHIIGHIYTSLSARRAWIEINIKPQPEEGKEVALRKESVDRNSIALIYTASNNSRSPQGERG